MLNPTTFYCELNELCNLACEGCTFHKTERRLSFSDDLITGLISEFAAMGGSTVVTCGGEASLEGERFWNLHRSARAAGLRSFSVTNGTRITAANARRWVTEGPSEITVSLDSHDPAKHDKWRGLPNWHVATGAINRLLAARDGISPRVYAMTIVAERSYRDLPDLYELVLGKLGADKLKLNMAQPTFGFVKDDKWFAENCIKDPDDLIRVIQACDHEWEIDRNPQWLADVRMYCESVLRNADAAKGRRGAGETEWNICNSGERNIWLSWKGGARLCPSAVFPGARIRTPADLRNFWQTATWRDEMASCKRYCGISHSVRREPSLRRAA